MSEGDWAGIILQDYAIYIASISAALGGLTVIYKKVVKPVVKHFKEWYDMMDKINVIFEEITPNDGSSIKDKINKIDYDLTMVGERFRAYLSDTKHAHFETDAKGNCTRVNRTYTRLVERETPEILGHGWHNCIFQEDRERVTNAWENAVDDDRELSISYRFETPSGKIIPVRGVSYKMTNNQGDTIGYLGKIKVLQQDNPVQ